MSKTPEEILKGCDFPEHSKVDVEFFSNRLVEVDATFVRDAHDNIRWINRFGDQHRILGPAYIPVKGHPEWYVDGTLIYSWEMLVEHAGKRLPKGTIATLKNRYGSDNTTFWRHADAKSE